MKQNETDEYSPEEAERRAKEVIRRSFQMPYKPRKELVGKTPRARARKRKSTTKAPPKSP
jgi:hypothetical protein